MSCLQLNVKTSCELNRDSGLCGLDGIPILESDPDLRKIRGVSGKVMAPHSSILAWKILWVEEPGRLQSMSVPLAFAGTQNYYKTVSLG